jgi:signal transduction histidine kinase
MLQVADLRTIGMFHGLADGQLAELAAASDDVRIEPGAVLFRQGEPADFWWVLLDGTVDLSRQVGQENMVVARMRTPGQWAGGFRAWDEHGVYLATGVGVEEGRMLRIAAPALRRLTDAWFPLGAHLVAGMFTTARSIEATARQRESLVTLGKLSAGLAHELNNPAAAATRAVDALQAAGSALETSLEKLVAAGITAAQLAELGDLRRQAAAAVVPLGALALSDLEEDLTSWLEDHDVDQPWLLAPALAAAGGTPAWCGKAADVLGPTALAPGLEWVSASTLVGNLLAEVKESTGRIFALVAAMKSYSQMDRASLQRVDVTEGLESTLMILGDKIPDGVTVVRDYARPAPIVEAYAGELNQVWTSLLDNALDAIGGTGTLRITTRAEGDGDGVIVEIADTGPGLPPTITARAFEPFFTTKAAGEGAGLGLDIARRIVEERHSGTIAIDSLPGETVLRVRLPNRPRRP